MAHCYLGGRHNVCQPAVSFQDGLQSQRPRRAPACPPICAAPCESRAPSVAPRLLDVSHSIAAVGVHPDAVARRREAEQRRAERSAAMSELAASDTRWWDHKPPKNMIVVSTAADLEQTLRQALVTHKLCVVDWFAPWCHACRSLYPKMRQIAEMHTDVLFIKANADSDEMRELCVTSGVRGLPYFRFHASGQVLSEFPANLHRVGKLRGEIEIMKLKLASIDHVAAIQTM